jgi:hypothetical protein
MNKLVIIGIPSDPAKCEYCGNVEELRPYGKNGAKICFECGMKPENRATTDEKFIQVLSGESELPTDEQSN